MINPVIRYGTIIQHDPAIPEKAGGTQFDDDQLTVVMNANCGPTAFFVPLNQWKMLLQNC